MRILLYIFFFLRYVAIPVFVKHFERLLQLLIYPMILHFLVHCLHEIVEGNPSQTLPRIGTTGKKIDQKFAFALHSALEIFSHECSRDFYWLIIQLTVPIEQNLADSNLKTNV